MAGLTAKQKQFVEEYLIDLNATQAAIRAGYSKRTAEVQGHENLRKPYISSEIERRMKDREKRTEITQDRVLAEYAKIAFADIKDFLEYKTAKTVVDRDDNGRPIIGYKQIVDAKPSEQVDGTLINEVSIGKGGIFKFKLHDKKSALDSIAKHLGMFIDRQEITGKDGQPLKIIFGIPRPEDKNK